MNNIGKNMWSLFVKFICFILYNILHLKISEKTLNKLLQFIKFTIVGLSNTVISYMVYLVVLLFLQRNSLIPKIDYLVAQLIGFLLSVLWAFYWNRKYVFNNYTENIPWFQALLKTYCSYAFTGLFLNSILSFFWIEKIGISRLIAPVINLLISVPLNFILNKFWAFRSQCQ